MAFAETPLDGVEVWPVPAASGPFLAPLELASSVDATPDKQAEKIGCLRIGARLARSDQPVSLRDCKEGRYALRPLGFICTGAGATLDLEHHLARAIQERSPLEPVRCRMANGPIPSRAKADPGSPFSPGVFRIQQKHVATTLESSTSHNAFELRDVPQGHVLQPRPALHGAFWHDDFGRMRSHGSVDLAPIDARYVFERSPPMGPEH